MPLSSPRPLIISGIIDFQPSHHSKPFVHDDLAKSPSSLVNVSLIHRRRSFPTLHYTDTKADHALLNPHPVCLIDCLTPTRRVSDHTFIASPRAGEYSSCPCMHVLIDRYVPLFHHSASHILPPCSSSIHPFNTEPFFSIYTEDTRYGSSIVCHRSPFPCFALLP